MFDEIQEKAAQLNMLRTEISQEIGVLQTFLREQNVGVTVWCEVEENLKVGWARGPGGIFRFMTSRHGKDQELDAVGADFRLKFSKEYVHPLLDKITAKLDEKITEAKEALKK